MIGLKNKSGRNQKKILYLAVTPDKYELPLGVYDTAEDLLRHFTSKEIQKKKNKKVKVISINVNIEIEE